MDNLCLTCITGHGKLSLMTADVRLKLFAKFVNHQYASWCALYEMVTGTKAPKLKEITGIISGH